MKAVVLQSAKICILIPAVNISTVDHVNIQSEKEKAFLVV